MVFGQTSLTEVNVPFAENLAFKKGINHAVEENWPRSIKVLHRQFVGIGSFREAMLRRSEKNLSEK